MRGKSLGEPAPNRELLARIWALHLNPNIFPQPVLEEKLGHQSLITLLGTWL